MDEFSLIDTFFNSIKICHPNVILGIGDDAACVSVPVNKDLLISCDTLNVGVHFLESWDPYYIAYKGVMCNISDIAAMAGQPSWILLAISMPTLNEDWLNKFSQGLKDALTKYNVPLIGGDVTRGPLCMTYTIHGLVGKNKAVKRSGASPGDKIYVTGSLGAAAAALNTNAIKQLKQKEQKILQDKLFQPTPRIDFADCLLNYASASIDISDGLTADLNHICKRSNVGATIELGTIPVHHIVKKLDGALDFALYGGDDYELCFTIPEKNEKKFMEYINKHKLDCTCIGKIESQSGLRAVDLTGKFQLVKPKGYHHF